MILALAAFLFGLSGLLIFSFLLTSVVKKHCRRNNPALRWIKIYWVGMFIILVISFVLGAGLPWSLSG